MAVSDQIAQEKQRILGRLTLLEAERTRLSSQLNELEIAERAVRRFGGKAVATEKRGKGSAAATAAKPGEKRNARNGQGAPRMPLGEAALKAVQAHAKGASANELLDYITREFGATVRPNHLGMALQRHRRAGRLENRHQRWYLTNLA